MMGEFKVHRVRFFDYMPSGIRCMAFNRKADRLALARLNGSVEIFNFSNNYFQEKVIPGSDSRSIEAICWVGCDRLFTAGLNREVVEYDLERLCPKYTLDAFGGPIWTAACNSAETHFAFGCEDGSVKLFEILPDKIQFERNLDRQKGRILSLSWHKSGTLIAAGSLDVIRVFDVKSGHSVQRILVDRGPAGTRNKDCVVWNVAFLSDYTIVSGDSAGKVQLWDANKGTLIKTHLVSKWDVLSLSVSENEDSIVAGTSEGTVIQFQLLSPTIGDAETQWIRTRTFKHHTHDVRAVTETKTSVVSGGLDTQLVICPLMDKVEVKSSESVLRKVIFPHRSLVSCAKKPSLLLFQFPDQLELWRLGGTDTVGKPGESLPVTRKPEKLLQLKRKGDDHICCSTISECGHWIAYSTVSSIRLYQIQCDNNNISISKVSKLPKVLRSAHQLQFSADSSKLFVASEQATIHVISLSRSECKHVHTFKPKSGSSAPVHLLAASADGQWLTSANRHCEINVYNLKKLKHHCMVPVYNSLPSAMAIHPETNNLLMAHADQQVFEFSIVDKQYTDWSRKLQKEGLHRCRSKWHTPITHITFNPSAPSQVMLHDTHMFCIIDQSLPLVDLKAQFYSRLTPKDMSETDRPSKNNAFKMCKKYQRPAYRENLVRTFCSTKFDCIPLLHVNLLEDDWLVVVERPLIDIHSQLPAPVRQKKFGT